ncbi:MAG: iron donor protein CyaY [Candidatus Lambdaproteobacteria bacterium]|nr:iron donor protein CyaY [Candidatus Lambdaproteobacteria bacterium]
MSRAEQMSESEFRTLAGKIYARIDKAFEAVDPDDAECEISQGALTISLPDGAKWILSQQPPVRQLWLAVASLGRAYHFDYDTVRDVWIDDKAPERELISHLSTLLRDNARIDVSL